MNALKNGRDDDGRSGNNMSVPVYIKASKTQYSQKFEAPTYVTSHSVISRLDTSFLLHFFHRIFTFVILIFFAFQLNMLEEKSISLLTLVLMTIKRLDAYAYTIIVIMIYNQQNGVLKIIWLNYYKKHTNGDDAEGRINKKKSQI